MDELNREDASKKPAKKFMHTEKRSTMGQTPLKPAVYPWHVYRKDFTEVGEIRTLPVPVIRTSVKSSIFRPATAYT